MIGVLIVLILLRHARQLASVQSSLLITLTFLSCETVPLGVVKSKGYYAEVEIHLNSLRFVHLLTNCTLYNPICVPTHIAAPDAFQT